MSERYGIVYLGSKEQILHLIEYVFQREYKKKYLIDLFVGGFAVSGYALRTTHFEVIANDLNKSLIALYNAVLSNYEKFEEEKYKWVSRSVFTDVKENPYLYPSWFVGLLQNCWSFGANQRDYLYSRANEEEKHAIHQAIVFNDYKMIKNLPFFDGFYDNYIKNSGIEEMDYKTNIHKRTRFVAKLKEFAKGNKSRSHLLNGVVHLNLIENLSTIKKCQNLRQRFKLFSSDWKSLYDILPKEILENSFIYCDPPYENTKQYQEGRNFNYEEFWQWFRDCPYPVYVSSYKAPNDVQKINFELKNQLLDNGHLGDNKPKKKVKENIYWNGKGSANEQLVDVLFGEKNESHNK